VRQRRSRPRGSSWARAVTAAFVLILVVSVTAFVQGPRSQETAPPRIPLDPETRSNRQTTFTPVADDPTCATGCVVRVPDGTPAPALWSRDGVIYAAADARLLDQLRTSGIEPVVVWPNHETVPLYVLYNVHPDQEDLVSEYGNVRDRAGDIRLLAADRVPLRISDLYAVGIHVEKMSPICQASAENDLPAFSLNQTLKDIVAIGNRGDPELGDRQFDGAETTQAAEFLFCQFAEMGFTTRYRDFQDSLGQHQLNVVATPPNRELSSGMALITAHYDTLSPSGEPAPGADDNASGLAAMLQVANHLARQGFPYAVGFIAFGAEEPGLLGSAAAAERLADQDVKLRGLINLDAIGIPNDARIIVNGDRASSWIYRGLVRLSSDDYYVEWMTDSRFLSDDERFRREGYAAVMITTHPWGTEPVHHTANDRLENLDLAQIAEIGDLVWRWVDLQFRD
jgi:hypothetical protein